MAYLKQYYQFLPCQGSWMCSLFFLNIAQLIHKLFSFLSLLMWGSVLPSWIRFQWDLSWTAWWNWKEFCPTCIKHLSSNSAVLAQITILNEYAPMSTITQMENVIKMISSYVLEMFTIQMFVLMTGYYAHAVGNRDEKLDGPSTRAHVCSLWSTACCQSLVLLSPNMTTRRTWFAVWIILVDKTYTIKINKNTLLVQKESGFVLAICFANCILSTKPFFHAIR